MTAPFILGNPLDWLLAPDEWRPLRIALAASVGIVVWRSAWLLAQPRPQAAAAEPVPPTGQPSRRSLFPSRIARLEAAIDLVKTETDLALSQTAAAQASAGLAQARAQLAALLRELEPAPGPTSAPIPATPTLTPAELEQLVALLDLPAEQRVQLAVLIAAKLEENRR